MDFELAEEERRFVAEVEAFLAERFSPDVMDENPEQLSQTVDTPAKRAFMRELGGRGWQPRSVTAGRCARTPSPGAHSRGSRPSSRWRGCSSAASCARP